MQSSIQKVNSSRTVSTRKLGQLITREDQRQSPLPPTLCIYTPSKHIYQHKKKGAQPSKYTILFIIKRLSYPNPVNILHITKRLRKFSLVRTVHINPASGQHHLITSFLPTLFLPGYDSELSFHFHHNYDSRLDAHCCRSPYFHCDSKCKTDFLKVWKAPCNIVALTI